MIETTLTLGAMIPLFGLIFRGEARETNPKVRMVSCKEPSCGDTDFD